MMEQQSAVQDFHRKYGVIVNDVPTIPDEKTAQLRKTLESEENVELMIAIDKCNLVEIADALGDKLFVLLGTATSYGIDLEPIFKEICRSNMTKTGNLREDGKILKGKDWSPPDLMPILQEQSGA